MRLLSTLACGVRGAEGGSAEILDRAGGNVATWYSDFEGTVASTNIVSLDSVGGAVVYVNQEVRVRVKDSAGTVVREFVEADAAPGVEVISQSFTGADYKTGASGTNKPTTLQAVLDAVLTSFGTTDWNVLIDGSAKTVKSLATIYSVYFVVTDPDYGATGDGTTDDTSAINAALIAANAAGGGIVFFPTGTYRITAPLGILSGTTLRGAVGATLTIDHATDAALSCGAFVTIVGLNVQAAQAHTGDLILHTAAGILHIERCTIGNANTNGSLVKQNVAATQLDAIEATFTIGDTPVATTYAVEGNLVSGRVRLLGCLILCPAATWSQSNGVFTAFEVMVTGCYFSVSATTPGASDLYLTKAPGAGRLTAVGNIVSDAVSSANDVFAFVMVVTSNDAQYAESGNVIGKNVEWNGLVQGTFNEARVVATTKSKQQNLTATGGTLSGTIDTSSYRAAYVDVTDGTATTINWSTIPSYIGEEFTVLVRCTNAGGSGNLSIGTIGLGDAKTTFTLALNEYAIADYVAVFDAGGNLRWVQRGAVQTGVT